MWDVSSRNPHYENLLLNLKLIYNLQRETPIL